MVLVGIPSEEAPPAPRRGGHPQHSSGRQKFVIVMLFPLVCTGSLWPTPAGGVMMAFATAEPATTWYAGKNATP